MRAYGVGNHSLDYICKKLKDKEVPYQVYGKPILKKFKALLFTSVKDFISFYHEFMINPRSDLPVSIILDNPLELSKIDNIVFLDLEPMEGIYFKVSPFDFEKIKIKNEIKLKPMIDLVANLLVIQREDHLFHHYNSFIMALRGKENRNEAIKATVLYFFGKISYKNMTENLKPLLPRSGKALDFHQAFIKCINEDYGMRLKNCLAEFYKIRDVNLFPKFSVSSYEASYLCSKYNSIIKQEFNMEELQKQTILLPNSVYDPIE